MLKITCEGVYYKNGGFVPAKDGPAAGLPAPEKAREGTMAHASLKACRRRRSTAASLSPPTRASFILICGSGTPPPAG